MTSPSKKRGKMSGEHLARDNPRLYGVWCNMKTRCYNPNVDCYRLYGGKGVKICEEWQEFKPFCLWALANGYDENAEYGQCTIDRINPNGDYEPSNCRWATAYTQTRNNSANKYITLNGKTQTITDWSRELKIPLSTISVRLKRGWSNERALSQRRWIRGDAQS